MYLVISAIAKMNGIPGYGIKVFKGNSQSNIPAKSTNGVRACLKYLDMLAK